MEQALKILNVFDMSKVSRREHALVYLAVVMVFVTAFNYLVMPKHKQIRQLEATAGGLQVEIDGLSKSLSALQQSPAHTPSQAAGAGAAVSDGGRISTLLEEITQTARVGGVDFVSVRPEAITDKGSYMEMRVRIDLKSRYREVGEYLERLQGLSRPISVTDVKIVTDSTMSPRVSTEIHLLAMLGKT